MKTAVIDAGGGMRGMYAAGVLDGALETGVHFNYAFGVSAGSANLISYIAGQEGRAYMFYREYSGRPEYMSPSNFVQTGSFINMDYIYSTLSNSDGEYPLDFEAADASDTELTVVATNAITGKPAYFSRRWMDQDSYDIFKASCSIPVVNKPYSIGGVPFFDGALSDPIPLEKALEKGADKVVIILTKPKDTIRKPTKDKVLASLMKHYPLAAEGLRTRADRYNETVARAKELEKEGRVLIIAPDDTCGVDTLNRSSDNLHKLYVKGLLDGLKIKDFLEAPIVSADKEQVEADESEHSAPADNTDNPEA
ncbi:patatin-like phospholipase family protein [Allobaculum mucilyticum]|uniref:patatin-like phospholipase family protein n=1 Tax=Allobaculum mucilyticum TaxID=2834459 RepID=UPI001E39E315|nr:patatin family protein [Allobaculum mucilyticum]UNT97001.1 patatin family protein [Allobaculum mucilyticum]